MKTQKDHKTILVEYCGSLSDADLRFLGTRLIERYSGDLGDALDSLSKKPQIDNILGSARSAEELYQLCDVIGDLLVKEAKKRKVNLWAVDRKKDEKKDDRRDGKPFGKKRHYDCKPFDKSRSA